MDAAVKVLANTVAAAEDLFEAARKAFFSAGDAAASTALPTALETVFAKEAPGEPSSAPKSRLAAKGKHAPVLVHA
jgi:hypothetical protein